MLKARQQPATATGNWTRNHTLHTESQLRGNLEYEINKWAGVPPVCLH